MKNVEMRISSPINITEHRAPTDESVKLLKEMEEKALEKVLGAFEVKNNVFSATIIFYNSVYSYEQECRIKLKLNGKEFNISQSINQCELFSEDKQTIINKFITNISVVIAQEIIKENIPVISENLFRKG